MNKINIRIGFIFVLIVLSNQCLAYEKNFDCKNPRSEIEGAVCSSDELSSLNRQINDLYNSESKLLAGTIVEKKLKETQVYWLEDRDRCGSDYACLKKMYQSRFTEIRLLRKESESKTTYHWDYLNGSYGKGEPICDQLKEILNDYVYPENYPNSDAWCTPIIIGNYSGFKQPPWEELDAKQHEELIFKLFKLSTEGVDGYFWRGPKDGGAVKDEISRKRAKAFIQSGGKLKLWRARLVKKSYGKRESALEQAVVAFPVVFDHEKMAQQCPGLRRVEWNFRTYVVTPELDGPSPEINATFEHAHGANLILFNDDLYFISAGQTTVTVYPVKDFGLISSCELNYD